MDTYTELLLESIERSDITGVKYYLKKGARVNKICTNGYTALGWSVRWGNLQILKLLMERISKKLSALEDDGDSGDDDDEDDAMDSNDEQYLRRGKRRRRKKRKWKCNTLNNNNNNIGYFVVRKDCEESSDEGSLTPDGMELLEWDVEIDDAPCTSNNTVNDADNDVDDTDLAEDDDDVTGDDDEEADDSDNTRSQINIYKWYAKILSRTSLVLKSPENDVGRLDRHGYNVVHYAIAHDRYDVLRFLHENYASEIGGIDQRTRDDCSSALHLAVVHDRREMARYLIANCRADPNAYNARRETPLHVAVKRNEYALVELLLDFDAVDANVCDRDDRTPLASAIGERNEAIARLLIAKRGGRLHLNREESIASHFTVLYRSVSLDLYETTRLLLENGAKIVQSHHLVHLATNNDNRDMVALLHRHGCLLNVRDSSGNTPLMVACKRRHLAIAAYLLENGAQSNTINCINGMTALHVCLQEIRDSVEFERFLRLLIAHRIDLNTTCYHGTAFFYSLILENFDCAAVLIRYGVDVNLRDDGHFSYYYDNLSLAIKTGAKFGFVRLMLMAGYRLDRSSHGVNGGSDVNSLLRLRQRGSGGAKREDELNEIHRYLMEARRNPLKLKELCRIRIRNRLVDGRHHNMMSRIRRLPLPTSVLDYLALDYC